MKSVINGWAVKWRSGPNNVDKKVNEHFLFGANWAGVLFKSRKAARDWAREHYGYIARRADLRAYPHDRKPPVVVRAALTIQEIEIDDHPKQRSRPVSKPKRRRRITAILGGGDR